MQTQQIEIEDFSINQEPGKETVITINLKDGSFVKVGIIELREYDVIGDLDHFLRDPYYYHSDIVFILEIYLSECEDYKIEREG